MNKDIVSNKPNLSSLIRRKITIRILICFLLLFSVLSTAAVYDVSNIFKNISKNLFTLSQNLSEFILSQSIIQNQKSISLSIDKASKDNEFQVKWEKNLSGSGQNIKWEFPFAWKYTYYIRSLDGKNFGALGITGSLLKDEIFVKEVLFSILLLFTLIIISSLLLPLANKIPNELFLNPIMNLLSFLKNNQKDSIQNVQNTINSCEMYEITNTVSSLIDQVKQNAEFQAIGKIAMQVAHDIRSPASAILMLAKEGIELPEAQRISLRDAAHRIQDIANNLITRSQSDFDKNESTTTVFLISTAILSVISEKKLEYKHSRIIISHEFSPNLVFCFTKANLVEFKRVISNLLNNAIDSMSEGGKILIKLLSSSDLIKIEILDTGHGMSKELVDKILQGQVVSRKANGLGLGFSHARNFLNLSNGQLHISSQQNHGTSVSLIFPKQPTPSWIASEINFYTNSLIIILDDDISIHGAWDTLFSKSLKKYSELQLLHFTKANECIEYIKKLSSTIFNRVLLLTDYEILKEHFNGLDVVDLSGLHKAILVTSHYENQDILKRAILLNTKILPKVLASEVKLNLKEKIPLDKKSVHLVVVEDDKEFSDILVYLFKFRGKTVDLYNDCYDLLDNLESYNASKIKICLDFNLGQSINGIELAELLYAKGFRHLYLSSGYKFNKQNLPSYLQVLSDKMDMLNL